jgi:hypothetical protein
MRTSLSKTPALSLLVILTLASACLGHELVRVPAGNRNSVQPPIPNTSALRAKAFDTTYEEKYQKIVRVLREDKELMASIKKAAQTYQIDPIHIVGALVGEHTYNITIVNRVKSYYVKALAYSQADFKFSYKDVSVQSFLKKPEFAHCDAFAGSAELWECRDETWDKSFLGVGVDENTDGIGYPLHQLDRRAWLTARAPERYRRAEQTAWYRRPDVLISRPSRRAHAVST